MIDMKYLLLLLCNETWGAQKVAETRFSAWCLVYFVWSWWVTIYHNQSQKKKGLVTLDVLLRKDNSNLLEDLFFLIIELNPYLTCSQPVQSEFSEEEAITTGWSEAAYQIQGPSSTIKHLPTT